MKTLIKNGVKGLFSDKDWETGQPQRYGWQEEGKEKKELPKEIIQFIQRRRPPEIEPVTIQDQMDELSQPDPPELVNLTEKKRVSKPKMKSNDNPKQKGRASGKHKPGAMETT